MPDGPNRSTWRKDDRVRSQKSPGKVKNADHIKFLNLFFICTSLRMSAGQASNKVKFDRRRAMDSDDDHDLEGL